MNPYSLQSAIGILDSGVGGLTVVKEVFRQLPKEKIVYFGDTKRCPYGPRSPEQVRQFTLEIVCFLSRYPMKALVIACNTATAVALKEVRRQFDIPVLGVIEPGARAAIKATRHGRIGVIGTNGTIKSEAYLRALKKIERDLFVESLACPSLVPLVESGCGNINRIRETVHQALAPLQKVRLDTMILGCTHYPLISTWIGREMGDDVTLISSAEETARELSTVLHDKKLLSLSEVTIPPEEHRYFTTGKPDSFQEIAECWLGQPVQAEHVRLDIPVENTLR
ncbi:glutamate racemase [Kroppenstedtia pulmonis]|uniref:glutamate racemase n=1 Tax=Kroppenstedtia pulmonis TaxID=1380685 RepID=UPI0015647743|nr:glutamate racemase [Kroppenstedtia pulmonis]